MRSKKSQRG